MITWNVDSFFSSFHFKRTPSQEEQKSIFRQVKIYSMASLVMMPFSKIKKIWCCFSLSFQQEYMSIRLNKIKINIFWLKSVEIIKVQYQKDYRLNAHILKQFIERNQHIMYHFILNPLITCSLPSSVLPGLRTHVLLDRIKWHYQGASKPG
jgi:hypothetical protein